jgi:radical SAM superfamily enzyme YgiQ (UPF0313 family)
MKISISFPPLESEKGIPLLGQNRQFQWFNDPTFIYPVIPASAATLLKNKGYEVIWDDAIAQKESFNDWLQKYRESNLNLIALETKTPVVKKHWKIISKMKEVAPQCKIVIMGDHVTALPLETLENCPVDYVLTGGDFDFSLLSLADHLTKKTNLCGGFYWKENGQIKNSGLLDISKNNLNSLPFIDRDLTQWKLYAYKNGNYKYTPGTYTMAARDCWWGRCSFCSWTTLFPGEKFRTRSAKSLLDEFGILIEKYKVKEIMDDSGSFPIGSWLKEFCEGMIERGYNKKIRVDCNMRLNALNQEQYNLMRKAGFRFILYGLESANQKTLDRINKNLKVEEIEQGVAMAKKAGLDPHITTMIGYPWETKEDAQKTIRLSQNLFKKGYVDTLQATIVIPYPGTPLFKYCSENQLLNTKDWDRYDMREPIMKTPISQDEIKKLTQGLYKSFMSPRFILRKVLSIRGFADLKFFFRAGKALIGHLLDFSNKKKESCPECEQK